eukprot:Partr_v1_DN27748_c1_g1_i1_m67564 putative Peroxisomal biogenesis factor 2
MWNREFEVLTTDHSTSKPLAGRVNPRLQIDGDLLTNYMRSIMTSSLRSIMPVDTWKPEMSFIVNLVFSFYCWRFKASAGDAVMGFKYSNLSRSRLIGLVSCFCVFPYVHERLSLYLQSSRSPIDGNTRDRILDSMQRIQSSLSILSMCNFLLFVRSGRYKSLVERLLQLEVISVNAQPRADAPSRSFELEILNRQLIWSHLTTFLVAVAPVIPYRHIRNMWRQLVQVVATASDADSEGDNVDERTPSDICLFCLREREQRLRSDGVRPPYDVPFEQTRINIPYQVNCGHVFCYYCSFLACDRGLNCPRCFKAIFSLSPADGSGNTAL